MKLISEVIYDIYIACFFINSKRWYVGKVYEDIILYDMILWVYHIKNDIFYPDLSVFWILYSKFHSVIYRFLQDFNEQLFYY